MNIDKFGRFKSHQHHRHRHYEYNKKNDNEDESGGDYYDDINYEFIFNEIENIKQTIILLKSELIALKIRFEKSGIENMTRIPIHTATTTDNNVKKEENVVIVKALDAV